MATAADLVEILGANGSFTVFAPTNAAFDKVGNRGSTPCLMGVAQVPSSTLTKLLTDKEALTTVLQRHILPRTIFQKVRQTKKNQKKLLDYFSHKVWSSKATLIT